MNFEYSNEHVQLRASARKFAEEVMAPLVDEAERTEIFPRKLFPLWADYGFLGVRYPEEDGGVGFDKVADCIVREEFSKVSQSFASSWSAHTHLGIWPIWKAGTEAQKERFFRPALAGQKIAGFGLSEPDGGSDIRAMKTRATKVDGGYQLAGSKMYITNAPIADFLLLAARTAPELKPESISLFIVELPNPGFSISSLEKEGIRASETGLIYIDEAFVPDYCLLGGREGTYPNLLDSLSENRVGVAANCVGIARAAYEAAKNYASQRMVRGKLIGNYQAIGHRLADMAAEIEAAAWLVNYGAWRVDNGTIDAATAAKVKLVASETAVRVTESSIRLHGGAGIMSEYPVGRYHRDALVYVIGEGTAEIQRNIIARSLGFTGR